MANERSAVISIGGKEYELVLTTLATKEVAAKYGGLDKMGESLMTSENLTEQIDEVLWLIALLANQEIIRHNHFHPEDKQELLTEDIISLLTTPADLAECKNAIMEAIRKGTNREVESEADTKNTAGE